MLIPDPLGWFSCTALMGGFGVKGIFFQQMTVKKWVVVQMVQMLMLMLEVVVLKEMDCPSLSAEYSSLSCL